MFINTPEYLQMLKAGLVVDPTAAMSPRLMFHALNLATAPRSSYAVSSWLGLCIEEALKSLLNEMDQRLLAAWQ